jgi:hypothetical protein
MTVTRLAAAAVAAGAIGIAGAGIAAAEGASDATDVATAEGVGIAVPAGATTQPLGSQGKLVDGNVVQGWTVTGLKQSTDTIPYPVAGTLWEVTATDEAIQGGATPFVSNFNVRAKDGQTYRSLFGVATPQGVNPSTLNQGQETTGKIYFDVTGEQPDNVVYNAGGQDLLVWTPVAPEPRQGTQSYPSTRGGQTAPTPAATPASVETTPEGTPAAAGTATEGTPLPASAGTVPGAELPAGSSGTPLTAVPATEGAPVTGSQGTPLPAGAQGEPGPVPAAAQEVPAQSTAPSTTVVVPPPS